MAPQASPGSKTPALGGKRPNSSPGLLQSLGRVLSCLWASVSVSVKWEAWLRCSRAPLLPQLHSYPSSTPFHRKETLTPSLPHLLTTEAQKVRITAHPKTVPAPASVSLLPLLSTLITGVGRHMTKATFFLSTLNASPGPGRVKSPTSPAIPYHALALGASSERGLLEPPTPTIHSSSKQCFSTKHVATISPISLAPKKSRVVSPQTLDRASCWTGHFSGLPSLPLP